MNSARTLADRFRTQRTDRIRVDGVEVLSIVEIEVLAHECIEVVVEHCRTDVEQSLRIRSPSVAQLVLADTSESVELDDDGVTIVASEPLRTELCAAEEVPHLVQLWNTWIVGETAHSWTGNSGLVLEELDTPSHASRRLRLWCSDGLGDPEFDDLVVVLTVGQRDDAS